MKSASRHARGQPMDLREEKAGRAVDAFRQEGRGRIGVGTGRVNVRDFEPVCRDARPRRDCTRKAGRASPAWTCRVQGAVRVIADVAASRVRRRARCLPCCMWGAEFRLMHRHRRTRGNHCRRRVAGQWCRCSYPERQAQDKHDGKQEEAPVRHRNVISRKVISIMNIPTMGKSSARIQIRRDANSYSSCAIWRPAA